MTFPPRLSQLAIFILLACAFLAGYASLSDYGMSWDEPDIYRYGEYALNAYQYLFRPQELAPFDTNLNYYGPAYFMLVALLARGAADQVAAWHLLYFVTFLAGVYVLYLLSKRWMSAWAAFGAALLFLTQPLLWGHAFINPKDTPFMTFFMASIYLGLEMADAPRASLRRAGLILAAGMLLGLTVSFRVLGPLAGIFVAIYAVVKSRRDSLAYLLPFALIAILSAYLTWPYLWRAPIANYLDSLKMMSQFPFDAKVLFWGELYPPDQVPRSYFPTLFVLQLTEPLLILSALGGIVMLVSRKLEPLLLFAGWFVFPASAVIAANSVLYDNARQLYFILPPLFFAAGFALDAIFNVVSKSRAALTKRFPNWRGDGAAYRLAMAALLALAALPGILSIVQLHPYEYAYYNALVGGLDGAYRQHETDYWGTSFKQALEYVNARAEKNARALILSGPEQIARAYARPDLRIITEETDPNPQAGYDYVLILTRKNQDPSRCKKSDTVYTVARDGAVFVFVQKVGAGGFCK